jgi:hypothetical protein
MAEREVIATRKAPDGDILALCNPVEPSWSPRAKDDVIQDIEDRIHSYFVQGTDARGILRRVSVYVVDGADPPGKYLRTSPDLIAQNNLRELPACLPKGPAQVPNRVRRNVATVSQAERNKLRDAILGLNQRRYQDLVSYWFKQDQVHQATHVHEGPAFLPWHRELVNRFEALLQEVDPTVALHYWDWQTDPRSSPDRRGGTVDLFTEGFMGSPGLPDEEQRVGKPFDEVSGFDNGGEIAGSRSDRDIAVANRAQYPPQQITRQVAAGTPRNFNARDLERREEDGVHHDIGSDQAMIERRGREAEQYPLMRLRLEAEHNWVHEYIGGTIGGDELGAAHSAFEDPFVFLLHSNVDRLWASWQLWPAGDKRQVSWRLDPEQVYGNEGDTERAPKTVNPRVEGIMTPMEPWAGNPSEDSDFEDTISPWSTQPVVKNSKDPSVVRPPLYDQYVLPPPTDLLLAAANRFPAAASWAAMLLGLDLPDGDVIEATITYDAVDPATVEFVLESAPQVTWWKAIRVYDADGNSTLIETQEVRKRDSTSLPANQLSSVQPLVFHKAKFLGAKRICYRLGDLGILPPGSSATFRWNRDDW